MSRILYGTEDNYLDVTERCLDAAGDNDYVEIPASDVERATLFGDPVENRVKHIVLRDGIGDKKYDVSMILRCKKNLLANERKSRARIDASIADDAVARLADVQKRLSFNNGNIMDEGTEQLMSVLFIKPNDKVLELGSNIGRNTLVIGSILDDESNLVTLETDANIVRKLIVNRDSNHMKFHIENAALTKRQLIQPEHSWQSFPSDVLLPDHFIINSVSLDELKAKYNIDFTVLVADCEGALFYILQEFPELLQGSIRTLIVENDYTDITHKQYVDEQFTKNGFVRVWSRGGGWGPCAYFFWEVWQKMN
jgi:FkbM family methyltransferase